MSRGKLGQQEGPQTSEPYDTVGKTKASNKWAHDGKELLTQEPSEVGPQLRTCTHSIMGQPLQCIRHRARLVKDQAKVLEASRLWKNLGANPPSACSSPAIEDNNFSLGGADE